MVSFIVSPNNRVFTVVEPAGCLRNPAKVYVRVEGRVPRSPDVESSAIAVKLLAQAEFRVPSSF